MPTNTPSTPSSRRCAAPIGSSTPRDPQAVLAYLSRYTHRLAISNSRLIALDGANVTFKWKDYRIEGRDRLSAMTLKVGEFIRRFLLHVLPDAGMRQPPIRVVAYK